MIHWRQFSLVDGGAPKSAEVCGLASRYRFWIGGSGRRYLFTAVSADEIVDFKDAIVVLARRRGGDRYCGVEVVDVGVAGEPGAVRLMRRIAGDPDLVAFVHLLAASIQERQAITADLAGYAEALAA